MPLADSASALFRLPLHHRQHHGVLSRRSPINFPDFRSSRFLNLSSSSSFSASLTRDKRFVSCSYDSMPVTADGPSSSRGSVPQDSLSYSRAYWVSKSLVAWNIDAENAIVFLYANIRGGLFITDNGIEGYEVRVPLEHDKCGLPEGVKQKFPHISNYAAFKLPEDMEVAMLIRYVDPSNKCRRLSTSCLSHDYSLSLRTNKCDYWKQLGITTTNADVPDCKDDRWSKATGLQLPGVLDDLYSYTGPLGAVFNEETICLYLWAPTAHIVSAYIYKDQLDKEPKECIQLEEMNDVWCVSGPRNWEGCYYVYEVSAYHPSTSQIETCIVNDPYARGLSKDGKRTILVNLDDEYLKPPKWGDLAYEKPVLSSFSDISIYELHIRDFSANDYSVDDEFRGGYLAFTCQDSDGSRHLRRLCQAGLTHVHLLPTFHFGGVDDEKSQWSDLDHVALAKLPPDSELQQAAVVAIQDKDGYNWGYNPILWGVPKGSYASNPDGPCRTLEFRKMIQALNRMGLRVVLDVVYNHVHGSGPISDDSVLDKVVPGYYLRRNTDGFVEHSTCTNNTASEHFMVERLIIDDLLCWAVQYKVDGFRFDLMGHIMRSTMLNAKCALQRLSKDKDGVDGSKIFIYGEGWDFGEVANNGRGVNASQLNLSGTGIGSFNDRIRDAVLGGSPFGHPLQQGFVTGLSLQPNGHDHGDHAEVACMLAESSSHIQVGLAANLENFVFTGLEGEAIKGSEVITYGGSPVAYTSCPTETVNYVSAHDNETLFDIISLKTPFDLSVEERCRINHLATSIVALSQGIPFFHAGDEILRSKSLARDSYNSGDWFNRLDFTYESNNWGVGLPPKGKNEKNWPLMKPRLADPSFKPSKSHILAALRNFEDLLRIRYSSPLFRLRTANTIQERVRFHNSGPSWVPGVIAMSIEDGHRGLPGMAQLDDNYSCIVIIINASPTMVQLTIPSLRERRFQLHPVQIKSIDKLVRDSEYTAAGCFTVSHRTTSVFVEVRGD